MKSMSKTDNSELERIIRLMQTDESFDAPPDAVQWSKNIFRTRRAAPRRTLVERVLASLQMDLAPNRAAFGERSATATQVRQMLFQAGENSIDLRITPDKKNFTVRGQILGENFANCAVKLGDFETTANELSEFGFAAVPGGKYALSLQSGRREIVVEEIEIA